MHAISKVHASFVAFNCWFRIRRIYPHAELYVLKYMAILGHSAATGNQLRKFGPKENDEHHYEHMANLI
jgi:hypothetical protein